MDCFKDFILPRQTCNGPNTSTPKSRLWVDDLPGFSSASLAQVADANKYATGAAMIEEKSRLACAKVVEKVGERVQPYILERAPLEAGELGEYGTTNVGTGSGVRGIRLKMDTGCGILMKMLIPRIWFKSSIADPEFEVTIKDGLRSVTYKMPIEADVENVLDLHYLAFEKVVDITFSSTVVNPITTSTKKSSYFASCVSCTHNASFKYLAASGLSGSTEGDEAFGVRAQVVATCSFEAATCMLLEDYRWAILYQFGVECLDEWLISGRMNFLAIHGRPWAEAQMLKWEKEVEDRISKKVSNTANFLARLTPQCVKCGTGTTYGYSS